MAALPFDPLATRGRRLATFFLLYVSEGLPYGFTVTAVATQMRRLGLGPAEIGAFVGALYLPWAFKWAAGPIVDTITVPRLGPRRFWILLMQLLMTVTLVLAMPVELSTHLALFTALIVLHNVFAATQDVAIDALACNVLPPRERGVASGFMFAGQAVGKALGGGGILYLTSVVPFRTTFLVVAALILLILAFVTWRIREAAGAPDLSIAGPGGTSRGLGVRMRQFLRDCWTAFSGHRAAWLGLLLALLPMGAMGLGLALQTTLGVELGLSDERLGLLAMLSALMSAIGCVVGGWMSDRFGRRRMSGLFILAMSIPTVVMALSLAGAGIVEALDPAAAAGGGHGSAGAAAGGPPRVVPGGVLATFWMAVLVYNLLQGLMYGASTALFMDLTTPRVAGTQFTAYMALANLAISFSAFWQGVSIERFGYPVTLGIDAVLGILGVGLLPFLGPLVARTGDHPPAALAATGVPGPLESPAGGGAPEA